MSKFKCNVNVAFTTDNADKDQEKKIYNRKNRININFQLETGSDLL